MAEFLTVGEFAEALGIDVDLARNWCEQGHVDCARPEDDTILIARSELESLAEGIDPAANKTDRVELFSRVNEGAEDDEAVDAGAMDASVYASFSRQTRYERTVDDEDDIDAGYYLDRYGMIVHRVSTLFEDAPPPSERAIEQASMDLATLLKPLRGTGADDGPDLQTVLQGVDALLEGRENKATYEVWTRIEAVTDVDVTLRTTFRASSIRDGEAVVVPVAPARQDWPVAERYLSDWRSELRTAVSELREGTTLRLAFVPSNCESYRFEVRACAEAPEEDSRSESHPDPAG